MNNQFGDWWLANLQMKSALEYKGYNYKFVGGTGGHDGAQRRSGERVVFERGFGAQMMGIDGTWRRPCMMEDVSETGAKLTVEGSIEGLNLKEFFLLLSSTGLAYRRCELAWVNGDQIGVNFLKAADRKKKAARGGSDQMVEV